MRLNPASHSYSLRPLRWRRSRTTISFLPRGWAVLISRRSVRQWCRRPLIVPSLYSLFRIRRSSRRICVRGPSNIPAARWRTWFGTRGRGYYFLTVAGQFSVNEMGADEVC